MNCTLDHLVLAARSLEQGVDWCERTLGITPAPGGRHATMGTHNRIFSIAGTAFARAYFEIIAIDPEAPDPGRKRWFGLDDPGLQAELVHGPRLVQWVARCDDLGAALAALVRRGVDGGRALQLTRPTAQGELRWRIGVPDDGARGLGGALPLLIEWGALHPADALPASGVSLESFSLGAGVDPAPLQALGLGALIGGSAPLRATLVGPAGRVTLTAPD